MHINDYFKRIIIIKDNIKPHRDEQGIVLMGIGYFLLDANSLEA